MRASQVHYTSCRSGQSGSPGFQIRAASDGLTPEELREVERIGAYRVPRNLDPAASAEVIARDFPVIYRFHVLSTGRWAITRSTYTGRDYSGRVGNFFAHTLVPESGETPLWPIDYFEWAGWQTHLAPEADTAEAPAPLPKVALDEIPPAESFSFDELQAFLAERAGRAESLARMLRAALSAKQTSRAVVIRDSFVNGLFWSACLQKSLPLCHAGFMTFSCYQHEGRDCEIVNVSVGQTAFAFSETERRFQFFVFDFEADQHSDVPEDGTEYAAALVDWLTKEPKKVVAFHEYMGLLKQRAVAPGSAHAVQLFRLFLGEPLRDPGHTLLPLVTFWAGYAAPDPTGRLCRVLAGATVAAWPNLQAETGHGAFALLLKSAEGVAEKEHRALVVEAWIGLFDAAVKGDIELAGVQRVRAAIDEAMKHYSAALAARFLEPDHLRRLAEWFPRASEGGQLAVISEVLNSRVASGAGPLWHRSEEASFLLSAAASAKCLQPLAERLLAPLQHEPSELSTVSLTMAGDLASRHPSPEEAQVSLGRALAPLLAQAPEGIAQLVREQLDRAGHFGVLRGEWLHRLASAREKKRVVQEFRAGVLPQVPRFAANEESWILETFLRELHPDEAARESLELLAGRELERLSRTLVTYCVTALNQSLSLDARDADSERRARLIVEAERLHGIAIQPDRAMLRALMRGALPQDTSALIGHLEKIPDRDYEAFLNAYFLHALGRVTDSQKHGAILRAVLVPRRLARFTGAYIAWVARASKDQRLSPLAAAVLYCLTETSGAAIGQADPQHGRNLRESLVLGLIQGRPPLELLEKQVLATNADERTAQEWTLLRRAITKRGVSLLTRVKGWVGQ